MLHRQPNRTMQRNRASLIVLIVLAFLLMVGAGILVSQLPEDEAWQLASQTGQETSNLLTGFDCDAAEAQTLYPYQDSVIRLTPDRVTCLDILGNERFVVDIDFNAPYAVQNGPWLLVADREGTGYAMITSDGEVYHGRLSGNIGGAAVSKDGMAALIQDRQDSSGIVTILEAKTGRHLFDCHFTQSGYVLSVQFNPDGESFDVNLVNTNGSSLYPILKRYSIDGTQLGQLQPDLSDLYPLLAHDLQGNPILGGAAILTAFTYGAEEPMWQRTYAMIHALSVCDNGLLVLAGERLNGPVNLFLIEKNGQEKNLFEIGETAIGPALSGTLVAVASGSRILVINSKNGRLIQEENMPADIVRFDFSGNSLIIVTSNGVSRLPIVES
ncbi:MAG: DUF5711 family protein [Bacillota bacterium]|nr:DUF5711 family protein [Bacillota bacterium]